MKVQGGPAPERAIGAWGATRALLLIALVASFVSLAPSRPGVGGSGRTRRGVWVR